MNKENLMQACESLKYDIIQKLLRFVRDNGEVADDYEFDEFGLDIYEDEDNHVTMVLNFFDNNGCYFFEPDSVNNDKLRDITTENYENVLYENVVHTAYQCLYIVEDENGRETLNYYRFTNGGLTWDDDQSEPDHGNCFSLNLIDLHYILQAININF